MCVIESYLENTLRNWQGVFIFSNDTCRNGYSSVERLTNFVQYGINNGFVKQWKAV